MSRSELRLLPEAQKDVADGEMYYRQRSLQAADGFLVALDHAFELIAEAPDRWPRHRRGTRRLVLQTYPYSVISRVDQGTVWVIAVAHSKRRPRYWKRRPAPGTPPLSKIRLPPRLKSGQDIVALLLEDRRRNR